MKTRSTLLASAALLLLPLVAHAKGKGGGEEDDMNKAAVAWAKTWKPITTKARAAAKADADAAAKCKAGPAAKKSQCDAAADKKSAAARAAIFAMVKKTGTADNAWLGKYGKVVGVTVDDLFAFEKGFGEMIQKGGEFRVFVAKDLSVGKGGASNENRISWPAYSPK